MRIGRRVLAAMVAAAVAVLAGARASANVESQVRFARGLVPFERGDWAAAYQLFDAAVAADPNDAVAVYYRGLARARGGDPAAAIPDFEQALTLDPDLPHAALDLGVALYETGRYAEARPWLERARQKAADRYTAALFLGLAFFRLGDANNALAYLNEARADPETRGAATYYAGLALLQRGEAEAARGLFAEVEREYPQSEFAQAARHYPASGPAPAVAGARPWGVYGALDIEYDSNVVIGPDTDNPGFVVAGLTAKADGRVVVAAGARARLIEGEYGSLSASYDFSQSLHFDLARFNLTGNRLQLEAVGQPGDFRYGIGGTYNIYLLDFGSFYQEGIALPWVGYAWRPDAPAQLYVRVRGRDFLGTPYDPGRDAVNYGVGIRQGWAVGEPRWTFSLGYLWNFEDTISDGPAGRDFQYRSNQFDVEVALPRVYDTAVTLAYLLRLDDYQYPNSRVNFAFARHDVANQLALSVAHELTPEVSLTLNVIGIANNSNILDFEYPRVVVGPGVRVAF